MRRSLILAVVVLLLALAFGLPALVSRAANGAATAAHGQDFCWLARNRTDARGGLTVQAGLRYAVPLWTNVADHLAGYWDPGFRPPHFAILSFAPTGADVIEGWSYRNRHFAPVAAFVPLRAEMATVCAEILRLRRELGPEAVERRLSGGAAP